MLQEIWIDGVLMDIDESTKITLDIKSNLFTEISKIAGNKTYTIRLPKTVHNLKAIGYANLPQNNTNYPYGNHTAKYIRNGIEIISNGYAYIVSVSDAIEMCIVWGVPVQLKEIFSDGKKLNEITNDGTRIDWERYNDVNLWSELVHQRDLGWVYAAIDFLAYKERRVTNLYTQQACIDRMPKMGYLRPCVFLMYVLNRLSTLYNIYFNIDAAMEAWLNNIIFPLVTDDANIIQDTLILTFDRQNTRWEVTQASADIFPDTPVGTIFSIYYPYFRPVVDIDVELVYTTVSFHVTCSENEMRAALTAQSIGCVIHSDDWHFEPAYTINILDENDNVWSPASATNLTMQFTVQIQGHISFSIDEGTVFEVYFQFTPERRVLFTDTLLGTINITPWARSMIYGMRYMVRNNLPDCKITDFLQWVAAITGTFPKQINTSGQIEFVPYKTIFSNAGNAVDWSSKLVRSYDDGQPKEIEYVINGWARRNLFRYKENDEVGTFADGSFTIDNVQLEAEQDIVPDIFEATNPANNVPIYEVNEEDDLNRLIAYLFPSEDETDEPLKPASNVEQRVLFVQPLTITGESNGTPVDMTLIQGAFDSSLYWSSILNSDRYRKLIDSLQNVKVLKEVFALTELDLKTFDETKPVYLAQYGHYYAVLEIKSSETGVAEVTLFQLEL